MNIPVLKLLEKEEISSLKIKEDIEAYFGTHCVDTGTTFSLSHDHIIND